MGSSPADRDPTRSNAKGAAPAATPLLGPEALAHVVLRCRELAQFLESVQATLPRRSETPFLYGQLDDVLRRLQGCLKGLVPENAREERAGGLLRLLSSKKSRAVQASEARYDLQGNAWTIPVTELVNFLSHSGKTGLLWVISPVETFVLEFAHGSLVHATSNAPPAAFRLGEIFVREGMLKDLELAELIQDAKAADDLLGSYLVRSGRLAQAELQRALAVQVQELFHRLMDAENAIYRFQEGAQLLRSQGLEVNITQLLLESARKKDEARERADASAALERDIDACLELDDEGPAPSPPKPASDAARTALAPDVRKGSEPAAALPGEARKALDDADGDDEDEGSEDEEAGAERDLGGKKAAGT